MHWLASLVLVVGLVCAKGFGADSPKELLVNFQGKSVAAWWDIGIADALREHLKDRKYDKIYFGGNSSGSLLPAYLGCWGVSEETIKGAREIGFMITRKSGKLEFEGDEEDWLHGTPFERMQRVFRRLPTEIRPMSLRNFVHAIAHRKIDGRDVYCDKPVHPFVIAAAKQHVIDDRKMIEVSQNFGLGAKVMAADLNESKNSKRLDTEKYVVYDKDDPKKVYGKPCTYFATPEAAKLLATVKDARCDIFEIKNYWEVELAMLASMAEPYFIQPVTADNFVEIHAKNLGKKKDEVEIRNPDPNVKMKDWAYNGGFVVLIGGQDIKKALGDKVWSLGTSMAHGINTLADKMVKKWYLVSPNEALMAGKKYLDVEIFSDFLVSGWYERFDKPEDFERSFDEGKKAALACFKNPEKCKPFTIKPFTIKQEDQKIEERGEEKK